MEEDTFLLGKIQIFSHARQISNIVSEIECFNHMWKVKYQPSSLINDEYLNGLRKYQQNFMFLPNQLLNYWNLNSWISK